MVFSQVFKIALLYCGLYCILTVVVVYNLLEVVLNYWLRRTTFGFSRVQVSLREITKAFALELFGAILDNFTDCLVGFRVWFYCDRKVDLYQCLDLDSKDTQELILQKFPSTYRFGRVQLRQGPTCETESGVRTPGKKRLFVRPGGKLFTTLKNFIRRRCRGKAKMVRNRNVPTRVEYESGTSTPFQGASFTLNDRNGTQVQNVTPQRLREMRNNPGTAHEGVEARSSILPRGSEVFDQGAMMARIARRVGLRSPQVVQSLRHVENPTGLVRGQTVLDVPIDIVPARQAISSDDRLPSRIRDQGSESTFVRVGAVEVAIEGLAAQGTDNVIAAVLYDARHGEPRNSIRGVQISSAAAVPTRVVYFPSTRLVNNSRVNEALRLAVVSPNSDMEGWEVAAVRTGVVAQIDEGSHQERLTRRTLQNEGEDRAMAAAYADHNCVVLTPPQLEAPVHGSFRIPLGRQTSMRMVEDGRWEEVIAPQRFAQVDLARRSEVGTSRGPLLRGSGVVRNWDERVPEVDNHVLLPEEDSPNEARAQNGTEVNTGTVGEPNVCLDKDFTFLPEASETDLFLHSFTADVATSLVPGKVLCKVPIQSVVNGSGRSAKALKYAISVDRAIKVVMNCKLAPMSALGIGAAFVDSGETASTVSCKEYLSMQSSIWNPAANSYHVFYLDPCKVGREWYPHWAGSLNSHFVLFMVDGWSNPPKTPARIMGSFYLADRKVREVSYVPMALGSHLQINKYLGTFELAQGVNDKAQRVELSLGSPSVVSVGYVSTVGTQLLAMSAYWQGKMVVQFTRTGSSFVGATLACALVLGGDSRTIALADIAMIPHHTFVVQADASSIIQEFPVSSMGMMYSTDRRVLHGDSRVNRGLQLAIWVKDSVTSVTDDKLKFAVRILSLEDLNLEGQNGGYPTKARAQYGPTELKYYDVAIFDGPTSGKKVGTAKGGEAQMPTRSSSKLKVEAAQTPQSSDDESAGITGQIVQLPVPNFWKFKEEGSSGSTHICSTPLSLLLDSAAYFKGTVHFKITWIANRDIKRSDMKGNFAYSVHPCGPESYASERKCFADIAGTTEFKVHVCGPLNGYLPFHMEKDILATPCVKLYVTKPTYMQSVHVQCAFGDDVSVAGHHVSADIKVEGASSWSEFHVS